MLQPQTLRVILRCMGYTLMLQDNYYSTVFEAVYDQDDFN